MSASEFFLRNPDVRPHCVQPGISNKIDLLLLQSTLTIIQYIQSQRVLPLPHQIQCPDGVAVCRRRIGTLLTKQQRLSNGGFSRLITVACNPANGGFEDLQSRISEAVATMRAGFKHLLPLSKNG